MITLRPLLVLGFLCLTYATALAFRVDSDASDWVFIEAIPPFARAGGAIVKKGHAGVYSDTFYRDQDARNVTVNTGYKDSSRHTSVDVVVSRQGQTRYLDHILESAYRDLDHEGRLLSDCSMVSISGNPVLSFCADPPICMSRAYGWRSGSDVIVKIRAHAAEMIASPTGEREPHNLPAPEPTEILAAYLTRYPSSLQLYEESSEQAQRWLTRETELQLALARYEMDFSPSGIGSAQRKLMAFVVNRQLYLHGPPAKPELARLEAAAQLPDAQRAQRFRDLWAEYHAWWVANRGSPVELYVAPTPTPVPSP